MRKPVIFKTENGDYKLCLKFSTLIAIRNENPKIDLIMGSQALVEDIANLTVVLKHGIRAGEARDISDSQMEDIIDDIFEELSIQEIFNLVLSGIRVKQISVQETDEKDEKK